ncbi:MAG: endolytic transglycosylase MltG, partial [Marmoricola sp.]
MSDIGLIGGPDGEHDGHNDAGGHDQRLSGEDDDRRRRGGRRRRGWIPALVLLVIAAIVVVGGSYGYGKLKAHFASAPDYAGPGSGSVLFEVKKGDSIAVMGHGLRQDEVVRSVDSFVAAARKDSRSSTIQVGFYQLKKKMRSTDALAVLVNPKNQIQSVVTVPEGSRVSNTVSAIVKNTDLKRGAVARALKQPGKLGLPAEAKGDPEGYLFPATYTVLPNETALELLKQMVAKTVSVEHDLGITAGARKRGLTSEQILTLASILEFEASRT